MSDMYDSGGFVPLWVPPYPKYGGPNFFKEILAPY